MTVTVTVGFRKRPGTLRRLQEEETIQEFLKEMEILKLEEEIFQPLEEGTLRLFELLKKKELEPGRNRLVKIYLLPLVQFNTTQQECVAFDIFYCLCG